MVVLRFATHASILISLCIRVVAATEGVVFEVVAEPQGPQGQAPQQEVRVEPAQGPANPQRGAADARQAPVHIPLF